MDSITKWLIRLASIVIILAGLILSLVIPIILLKINSQVLIAQNSVKEIIEVIIQKIIS
tara:strand:- start:2907 stop:3083 length:177 start_codon:yes stop_codon:yes gene_type:complete